MTQTARWMKAVQTVFLALALIGVTSLAQAADLPLAAASPMTGVSFDDQPLLLPVQRNFQMALLTASSELGRSCGRMEAYGWRMNQSEQARVNQIFNNTVNRLRLLGYSISPQTLTSVSKDITLFTADRANKHFIFLWSAGELGLVLNLCESTAPADYRPTPLTPSVQVFPVPMDVVSGHLTALSKNNRNIEDFTPVGAWVGSYTCAQGLTGGTLQIEHLQGKDFEGVFKFYPTPKNPAVPAGSYVVYGQYDRESKRILINPGEWIKRPRNYYNTVIVGGFDPAKDSFSAYFQGISGCTSFEASRSDQPMTDSGIRKPVKKARPHVKKKKAVKPSAKLVPVSPAPLSAAPASAALPSSTPAAGVPEGSAPVAAPTALTPAVPAPVPQATTQVPGQGVAPTVDQQAAPAAPTGVALPTDDKKDSGGGILLSAPTSGGK